MAFTDRVLEKYPQIDEKRLCVTGGSYGGFMTNWIIGHTHRFAAAASQRSIANWVGFGFTSDIGEDFARDQMGLGARDNVWNSMEKLWEHSPLKYLDNCSTPHPVPPQRRRLPLPSVRGVSNVCRPAAAGRGDPHDHLPRGKTTSSPAAANHGTASAGCRRSPNGLSATSNASGAIPPLLLTPPPFSYV